MNNIEQLFIRACKRLRQQVIVKSVYRRFYMNYTDSNDADIDHTKANNENLKEHNRILRLRPDLPVDRLPYIKKLDKLEEENKVLKARIDSWIRVDAEHISGIVRARSPWLLRNGNATLIIDDGIEL